ncbi:hypothetical protein pb186bvf_000932 [Paramecium bursaria]
MTRSTFLKTQPSQNAITTRGQISRGQISRGLMTRKGGPKNKFYKRSIYTQKTAGDSDILFYGAKMYKISKLSIEQYKKDVNDIRDNLLKNQFTQEKIGKAICEFLEENLQQINPLVQYSQQMLAYKTNRAKIDIIMSQMKLQTLKVRNILIQQRIFYIFGKLEESYLNPIAAAIYYKQCKRVSENKEHLKQRMKAYKGLGRSLMRIKPKLSQLYLTKYLMAAWNLNMINDELEAYDLLGKHYYYTGQLVKARQFHDRMTNGTIEEESSRVRQLAANRIEQWSQQYKRVKDHVYIDIDVVSSDDECYEIIFQDQSKVEPNKKNPQKKLQQYIHNLPDLKSIRETANSNIRPLKDDYGNVNLNAQRHKFTVSNPHINLGEIKDKVLMSHMTPNRKLDAYQYLVLTHDKTSYQNTFNLTGLYEPQDLEQITKNFNKLTKYLSYLQDYLQIEIKQNGIQERRRAVLI